MSTTKTNNTGRIARLFIAFILLVSTQSSKAKSPNDTTKSGEILAVPFIYYAPETGWATGGRLGYYRLDDQSNIYTNLFISQKLQFEIFFGGEIFGEHWKYIPKLKFSRWVDFYYGYGNTSLESAKMQFEERFLWGYFSAQRRFGSFYLGPVAEIRVERMLDSIPMHIPGSRDWHAAGLGAAATYDTRSSIYYPDNGSFFEITLKQYLPVQDALAYFRLDADFRNFYSPLHRFIIASQIFFDYAAGETPFQLLPSVGDIVRGYDASRFRANRAVAGQVETRFPIWKRFRGAAFFGIGDVFDGLDDIGFEQLKLAGGIGTRIRLTDNDVNLAVDFAVNRDLTPSFYIEIGEAF